MPEQSQFAYSLNQVEDGWRWSVYEQEGVTVAVGADATPDAAEAAVERTLRGGMAQDGISAHA